MAIATLKEFAALGPAELYAILRLRSEVFVVEQACIYQDMDDLDPACLHLTLSENGTLLAYCRLVPPGVKYADWSIGRVISSPAARGRGLGHDLMAAAKTAIAERGGGPIRISAQSYLEKFYAAHGFAAVGDTYLEDGIPHIEMLHPAMPGSPVI